MVAFKSFGFDPQQAVRGTVGRRYIGRVLCGHVMTVIPYKSQGNSICRTSSVLNLNQSYVCVFWERCV